MKANAAIARLLKREGVEYLFCYPSNALIEACAVEGIRPILARTERTVLAMADGYTRVHNGRKIGVCCFQRASGSENMFGGVAQVISDTTPVLVLPGRQSAAPISACRTRSTPKTTIATPPSGSRASTWSSGIPEMMRRAFSAASQRPARPGHARNADGRRGRGDRRGGRWTRTCSPKSFLSAAGPDDVDGGGASAGRRAAAGHHGRPGRRSTPRPGRSCASLPSCSRCRSSTTMNGKGAFPEDHPLSLGTAGAACTGTATAS